MDSWLEDYPQAKNITWSKLGGGMTGKIHTDLYSFHRFFSPVHIIVRGTIVAQEDMPKLDTL